MSSSRTVSSDRSAVRSWSSLIAVVVGVLVATAYFSYTLTISDRMRGIYFGDSADYINCSLGGLAKVWNHSSYRLFGYPFLLAICREIFPAPEAFLRPVFLLQFLSYLASSLFLLSCLRRTGLKIPWWFPMLLLAHPALIAMSTIPMTDTLTACLFSVALGVMILIDSSNVRLPLKGAFLGLIMGIACTFRPAIVPIATVTPFVVAAAKVLFGVREREAFVCSLKSCALLVVCYFAVFAPIYGKLRLNCYNTHHEQCIVPSHILQPEMKVSLEYAIMYSRWEVYFRPDGVPEGAPTKDRIFPLDACVLTAGDPTPQLLDCYLKNISQVPLYLFRRIIGSFDHRHLTIYGLNYTKPWVFAVNRAFSVVGFLGLFASAALFIKGLYERRLYAFLGVPLLYVAIQMNFHPEPRYMFLVTPLFFCVAISTLVSPPFSHRVHRCIMWLGAACLAGVFFYVTSQWDTTFLETYKYK